MKQEITNRWCKALRSGKYQQGKEKLKSDDGKFCCLGVLCEVYKEDHPDVSDIVLYSDNQMPIAEVRRWAEQSRFDLSYNTNVPDYHLPTLNDKYDYSFEQIADLIEKDGFAYEN